MRYFLIAVLAIAAVYILFIAGPTVSAFFFIFSRKKWTEPEDMKPDHECFGPYMDTMLDAVRYIREQESKKITVTAPDGAALAGYLYGSGSRRLAICFNGYHASPLTNFCVMGRDLLEDGYDILLVHQRAHGESGGDRCTIGLLESRDVKSWIDWADANPGVGDLVLCGVSMGSATLAFASSSMDSPKLRAMVLDCCYRTVYEQMLLDCRKWHLPGHLMVPVMRVCARLFLGIDLKQSTYESLAKTKVPAFFLHGTRDTVVPFGTGRGCYEACGSEKEMFVAEGAEHGAAYVAGGEQAKKAVFEFLSVHTGGKGIQDQKGGDPV